MKKRKRLHLGNAIQDALKFNKKHDIRPSTQKELADELGVDKSLVSKWIKEDNYSIPTAIRMTHRLFIDWDPLIHEIVERKIDKLGPKGAWEWYRDPVKRHKAYLESKPKFARKICTDYEYENTKV